MGRWYCCNDSYVSLSTLQGVLSEKVYILFFSRTNAKILPPTHNVKNRDCNGNDSSKNPRTGPPLRTKYTKEYFEHSSGMDTSIVDKVPCSIQIKLNSFERTVPKKILAAGNGKSDASKNQMLDMNGDVENKSEKDTLSIANNNGFNKNKSVDAADTVNGCAAANENGKLQNISGSLAKVDLYDANVVKRWMIMERRPDFYEVQNGGFKCSPDISGFKRKLHDSGSCILFAQDAHSLEKVEELKDWYVMSSFRCF